MVQKLWNQGHEISVHSISHRGPEEWWGQNATIEDWFDEMVGQANIINRQQDIVITVIVVIIVNHVNIVDIQVWRS